MLSIFNRGLSEKFIKSLGFSKIREDHGYTWIKDNLRLLFIVDTNGCNIVLTSFKEYKSHQYHNKLFEGILKTEKDLIRILNYTKLLH